jgi:hypothetical protein
MERGRLYPINVMLTEERVTTWRSKFVVSSADTIFCRKPISLCWRKMPGCWPWRSLAGNKASVIALPPGVVSFGFLGWKNQEQSGSTEE